MFKCKSCNGSGRQKGYESIWCYECGGSGLDKFRSTIKRIVSNLRTRWWLATYKYKKAG